MASAAGNLTRAIARSRVEIRERTANLGASGALTLLARDYLYLVAARCKNNATHRGFLMRPCRWTYRRFFEAIRRHRDVNNGGAR
jgi:hypothetical protein